MYIFIQSLLILYPFIECLIVLDYVHLEEQFLQHLRKVGHVDPCH